jgi:hypothetical protein
MNAILANLGWLLTALFVCFVTGGLLGFRLGVIHGYDRAEEMLEQITEEQYRKLKQKQVGDEAGVP